MKIALSLGACALAALATACASSSSSSSSASGEHAYGTKPATKSAAKATPPGPEDMAKMMEMWKKAAAVGPQHAAFAKSVGKWDLTVKTWMDAASPPMESKSTATRELSIDGRFLVEKVKGDMGPMGPFEGMGLLGYNNLTKQFDDVWVDSMGTGMMVSHGTEAADGTVNMTGNYDNPMGGKTNVRMEIHHVSADEQRFEMFEDRGQGEMKVMEITYKRAKG